MIITMEIINDNVMMKFKKNVSDKGICKFSMTLENLNTIIIIMMKIKYNDEI